MSDLKDSLHVLSPGDKSMPHVHSIITGRKSWKTLKGKTEAVWPPYLEAALFEGLGKYQPANPRATKSLGRFPNRNRFISEYILNATGKSRTPKQVGSRLQQLRDTCQGKQLLQTLSRGHLTSSSELSDDDKSIPSSPAEPKFASVCAPPPPRTIVSIDIISEHRRPNGFSPYSTPSTSSSSSPTSGSFPPSPMSKAEPRPIRVIDPTVTFTSRTSMSAYSSFSVLLDGVCVHSETEDLKLSTASCPVSHVDVECVFFYSTTLVPTYWKTLCECEDPTRYAILHDIIQTPEDDKSSKGLAKAVVLSVEYRFNYPDTPYSSPQLSPSDSTSSTDSSSTLSSPTSYNFDFIPDYVRGDGPDQTYSPVNATSHQDFLLDPPSICFPEFPADLVSALNSPVHDQLLSSYTNYDHNGSADDGQITMHTDTFHSFAS